MLAKRPLQGENADAWGRSGHASKSRCGPCGIDSAVRWTGDARYQPRTSSRSPSGSVLAEIPTIGAPSPADTSARIFGSA